MSIHHPYAGLRRRRVHIYRAFRGGLRIVYDPAIAVRHDHGRRTDADVAALAARYAAGRGAMYVKHALRGDGTILRHAYWEIAGQIGPLLRAALGGRDSPHERRILGQLLRDGTVMAIRLARGVV